MAQLDGPAREVKLLSDARAELVVQRTQAASRLRWFLHELDPELRVPPRGLRRAVVVNELTAWLADVPGLVARLARELLTRIAELNAKVKDFDRELRDRVRVLAPSLLEVPGCGVTTAAVLLGETADVRRFRSADTYARFTGTAPIPVWSGNDVRVRLNRGGNRSTNCALHTIAMTQRARGIGGGRSYVDKLLGEGKTPREAVRLLRRRLSDRVYQALRADAACRQDDGPPSTEASSQTSTGRLPAAA